MLGCLDAWMLGCFGWSAKDNMISMVSEVLLRKLLALIAQHFGTQQRILEKGINAEPQKSWDCSVSCLPKMLNYLMSNSMYVSNEKCVQSRIDYRML